MHGGAAARRRLRPRAGPGRGPGARAGAAPAPASGGWEARLDEAIQDALRRGPVAPGEEPGLRAGLAEAGVAGPAGAGAAGPPPPPPPPAAPAGPSLDRSARLTAEEAHRADTPILGELMRAGEEVDQRVREMVAAGKVTAGLIARLGERLERDQLDAGLSGEVTGVYEDDAKRLATEALVNLHRRMAYHHQLFNSSAAVRLLAEMMEYLGALEHDAEREARVRAKLLSHFANPMRMYDIMQATKEIHEAKDEEDPQDGIGVAIRDYCHPDEFADLLEDRLDAIEEEVEQRFGGAGAGKDFGRRLGSAEWLQAVQDNQDAREFRDYVLRFTEDLDLLYGITCDHLDEMGAKYD